MIPCAYDSMLRYAEYKLDLRELYIKCQIRLIFGILYMFLSRFLLKKRDILMLGKSLFGNLAPIRSVIWRENHNGKFLQHLFAKFVAKIQKLSA